MRYTYLNKPGIDWLKVFVWMLLIPLGATVWVLAGWKALELINAGL